MMYNIYISMKYIYAYMYRLYGGHYTALPQPVLPWLATWSGRTSGWPGPPPAPPPSPSSCRRPSSRLRRNLHVVVDGASLLDVRHLPNVGHSTEDGGHDEAGRVARLLAVDIPLQNPHENFLRLFH